MPCHLYHTPSLLGKQKQTFVVSFANTREYKKPRLRSGNNISGTESTLASCHPINMSMTASIIYGKREGLYNPLKYQAGVDITICTTTLISSKGFDLDRRAYPNSN